ncbi:hypothetical protein M446_2337 [Methylobacterium sp. 4-46]|uniref:hypothetical protein n=1 Tax=unclassified Methylobacterium TaxID=2615210 RepID=UPI000152E43E|nr:MULTISPECIES: hypothetical protein [Methylobacterium]ACA16796.1 hypothetical protein M446_2337 [Methylobacterium sp. 4-46]WFT82491.1 hypothetical protein QA634_11840 [Methylobacterium nodulans]
MGEAARDHAWQGGSTDSSRLQRLLLRPLPRAAAAPAVAPDEADEDVLEEELSRLAAENVIIKAALRSEQAEVAELRARLGEAAASESLEDVRADRDRWAGLVERLLFAGR